MTLPVQHVAAIGAVWDVKSGEHFLGRDGPTYASEPFKHENLQPFSAQVTRRHQPVVARAYDDGVVLRISHFASSNSICGP